MAEAAVEVPAGVHAGVGFGQAVGFDGISSRGSVRVRLGKWVVLQPGVEVYAGGSDLAVTDTSENAEGESETVEGEVSVPFSAVGFSTDILILAATAKQNRVYALVGAQWSAYEGGDAELTGEEVTRRNTEELEYFELGGGVVLERWFLPWLAVSLQFDSTVYRRQLYVNTTVRFADDEETSRSVSRVETSSLYFEPQAAVMVHVYL